MARPAFLHPGNLTITPAGRTIDLDQKLPDLQAYSCQMKQLPIIWQRLVSTGGATCQRCDATHEHLQSAVAKLKDVLKPLNIEPVLKLREIDDKSFRDKPDESNRIWIADKPLENWLGANVGSSTCCSVCGDAPCRTMEVEGVVFEDIPEAIILKASLIAAAAQMA